jgi:hypothetical protein
MAGQARDVEVDHLLVAGRAHGGKPALRQHAGVVDQHVHRNRRARLSRAARVSAAPGFDRSAGSTRP